MKNERKWLILVGLVMWMNPGCAEEDAPTDPAPSQEVEDGETAGPVEPDATDNGIDAVQEDVTAPPADASEESGDVEDLNDVAEEITDGDDEDSVEEPDSLVEPDVPLVEPDSSGPENVLWETCDSGDEAWAKRAIQGIFGRNPEGLVEVQVLGDLVAASDRRTVALRLMDSPEYRARWAQFLMDELRVNRVGDKAQYECYPDFIPESDGGALATHIRDTAPGEPYSGSFTMTDVLFSSLDLDDLSPLYRAHLFAMMAKPITGANVGALEMDLTRRQDFGEIFSAVYTHRGVVCAGCHNSAFGVTDHPDPEKSRHWALPGLFEKALYGSNGGRDEMEVYSAFRHLGVVGGNQRPWNLSQACGTFVFPDAIPTDPADIEGYLVSAIGKTGSIWDVENALRGGFSKLRDDGLQVEEETLEVDAEEGFAYLVATRIANQVWQEIHGYPLTLVHYIPRNEEQRDLLLELTEGFVANQFSLKHLVADIVTHPLTNQLPPDQGCGADSPYILPRIWNPWVLDEPDEAMRINNAGDGVHRKSARTMLRTLNASMDWPATTLYPGGLEEEFQKAIGVFVKDAEPGFLGVDFQGLLSWESRFGACTNQGSGFDWPFYLLDALGLYFAENGKPATLRQVLSALKDRMVTVPEIGDTEATALAAFLGVETLDVPAAEVEDLLGAVRQVCGLLAETPQFLLVGVNDPLYQSTAPDLVVNGLTYASQCEKWGNALFPNSEVSCSSASLTLSPEDAP